MSDTDPGRTFHFWVDFETTGLDPFNDTVLEAAWCFTDSRLRMLTPLSQRYTRISAKPSIRTRPGAFGYAFDPTDEGDWHNPDKISPYVREMHETSGLHKAWWDTSRERPHRILTEARDLFRLVAEDLDSVGFKPGEDTLVLSGAGVSHFDDSVLTEVFEQFYPPRPIIDGGTSPLGKWHYRIFDTSVAIWVSEAREIIDDLALRLVLPPEESGSMLPFDLIACEQGTDNEVNHLVDYGTKDSPAEFRRGAAKPHRAADDVVFSLTDARILRWLVTQR